ncbi:hypothetical protein K438DRAFT_1993340 [Mycena galopus ATCC 62051]|nr:hypothetical protein K438DRAFT_1993340 [Mycena galopus ATCC 62051]
MFARLCGGLIDPARWRIHQSHPLWRLPQAGAHVLALAYYQRYRRDDDTWLRYFVRLPSLPTHRVRAPIPPRLSPIPLYDSTGFDMQMTYQPLVLQHGQVLDYFPTVFVSEPLCVFGARCVVSRPQPDSPPQVLVSTPTQFFFAWCIWSLTRVRTTPVH